MLKTLAAAALPAVAILAFACAAVFYAIPARAAETCGLASWYAYTGHRTANGERFDGSEMTAASRTLPFNAKILVTHANRSVVVRINDRGPFVRGRILDLSRMAATKLGISEAGVARICYSVLGSSKGRS